MRYLLVLALAVLALSLIAPAAVAQTPATDPRFFPLDQVKPGMKGVGRTIFQGDQLEEFGFEVLGIMEGFPNPKQRTIIVRLTGPLTERTGVFAGMSGSPTYIDGKLVGAIAYGFNFSKESIGGITPIEQMVDIFKQHAEPKPSAVKQVTRKYSFQELASLDPQVSLNTPQPELQPITIGAQYATLPSLVPYIGASLMPIATPLSFVGIAPEAIQQFWPQLQAQGLMPVAAGGGGAEMTPLKKSNENTLGPGTSVSVQLVRGDFTLDALGTVTWRDGDKIYAFGHNFLGFGGAEMPMAEAKVLTVVPSVANSFKLGTGTNLVGTVTQDRSIGLYGKLGQMPKLIPVKVNVRTSNNDLMSYKYEMVADAFLSPLLLNITLMSSINKTERQLGDSTLELEGKISLRGHHDVIIQNRFSDRSKASVLAALATSRPLELLLNSGFTDLAVEGIEVNLTAKDGRTTGMLERLWIDKTEVKRGQTIELQIFARSDEGKDFVQRVPIEIPRDVPPGKLSILVGDGSTMNALEQRLMQSPLLDPRSTADLVQALNKRRKNDRLYVMLVRTDDGAIINNKELPALPPSMLATLNSARTSGGFTPVSLASQLEVELPPAQFVISGQRVITIDVTR